MKPSRPSLLLFRAPYDECLVVQPSSKSECVLDLAAGGCVSKRENMGEVGVNLGYDVVVHWQMKACGFFKG